MKYIFLLLLGFALGYGYGFKDSKLHDKSVVTRFVERVGGSARDNVGNNIDGRIDKQGGR